MTPRVLVACVGNIFLGDDGFGVEVAQRLAGAPLPPDVRVVDYGIRSVHLAYDLLEGYEAVVLVDASPQGGEPGTLYVIEPDLPEASGDDLVVDPHSTTAEEILALVTSSPARPRKVLVVACEPESVAEGLGLSDRVAAAVDEAVSVVVDVVDDLSVEV